MTDFALNPSLNASDWADEFASQGRVSIPAILAEETAKWLLAEISARSDWLFVFNNGDTVVELDPDTYRGLDPAKLAMMDQAIDNAARDGFQYRYRTIRIPDGDEARASSDDKLAAFARWWSDGPPREFLAQVIDEAGVEFADMQATAYSKGDFLTGHDDAVQGKNRFAAYVLGLTPTWRIEWGGLLMFHDSDRAEGFMPQFNRLNLLRVGQVHSVSEVAGSAGADRHSLTGWLRSGPR